MIEADQHYSTIPQRSHEKENVKTKNEKTGKRRLRHTEYAYYLAQILFSIGYIFALQVFVRFAIMTEKGMNAEA